MRTRPLGAMLATAVLAAASLVALAAGPAAATTISVADETQYRNALTTLSGDAAGPHTIDITADITLSGGTDPTYTGTQPLTLAGNGHTLDANSTSRLLLQNTSAALTVQGAHLTGGKTTGPGGGIFAVGSVTLTDSTVSHNTAATAGGGIAANGSATLMNSTVSDNTAGADGGGISASSATLTNSTISGNTTTAAGGGIGGGSSVALTNSTVSGNTATTGVGGGVSTGTATLVYATVVGNNAPSGANIAASTDTLVPFGSVIALPQGGGANCNVDGTTSNGFNFSDDTSCQLSGTGDRQNAGDPALGALASNGGPTQTRLPQAGSPLIDAIPAGSCQADGASGITTDQRGVTRPQGAGCDIGAAEVEVPGPTAPPAPPEQGAAVPLVAVVRFTG